MRLATVFGTGLYIFALAMGSLTLGSGCGSKSGPSNDVIVPLGPQPTEDEKQKRREFMKKMQDQQRKSR